MQLGSSTTSLLKARYTTKSTVWKVVIPASWKVLSYTNTVVVNDPPAPSDRSEEIRRLSVVLL